MFSFYSLGFKDPEWVFFKGSDPGLSSDQTACIAPQNNPPRTDFREFFDLPFNGEYQTAVLTVVGVYRCLFPSCSAAVSLGVYLKGDLSLSAGRDLSRIGDRRAPSAGFNFNNLQYSRPLIGDDEIVNDLGTIND